jgi:hypothetical protein
VLLEPSASLLLVWLLVGVEEEVQYDGRAGCHRVQNTSASRDRSLSHQFADMQVSIIMPDGESQAAYPTCLIIFSNIHLLAHAIGIPEGPDRQLMQDSYLLKDVKISEFFGVFVVTVGVSFRCFG